MKNVFKNIKDRIISAKGVINTSMELITNLATITSVIIVLLTLREMQIQRNNAYMPDIILEPVQVNISWGDTINPDNPLVDADETVNPIAVKIPSRNIGGGVAKQITYSIDISTYIEWLELLKELDNETEYTYIINGNQFVLTINGDNIMFPVNYDLNKVFLLPNAEEVFDLVIPLQYTRLLQEIYAVRGSKYVDIPDIKLSVKFTDIQDVKYDKQIFLAINNQYFSEDIDGNGLASYQIVMK